MVMISVDIADRWWLWYWRHFYAYFMDTWTSTHKFVKSWHWLETRRFTELCVTLKCDWSVSDADERHPAQECHRIVLRPLAIVSRWRLHNHVPGAALQIPIVFLTLPAFTGAINSNSNLFKPWNRAQFCLKKCGRLVRKLSKLLSKPQLDLNGIVEELSYLSSAKCIRSTKCLVSNRRCDMLLTRRSCSE